MTLDSDAAYQLGYDDAMFEHRRELDRLRADNAAIRAMAGMPPIKDETTWEAYVDALAAELEPFGAETAALHYAVAVANWVRAVDGQEKD